MDRQTSLLNNDQAKKWVGTCPPCPPSSDTPVLIDIGGTSASEELLDTVEVFFIVNEVWTVMVQSLPRTPASSAIVNINERMHLIGGLYGVYTQKRLRNIFIS